MELVTLVSDEGTAVGSAPKNTVHGTQTPLHLAFSCYVYDPSGRILLTRRALVKKTWPGVWTNSFCGHPAPDESIAHAITRRAQDELGAVVDTIEPLIPHFRYRAQDANGIEENEICPVFSAHVSSSIQPNPQEVMDQVWLTPQEVLDAVSNAPFSFSPWMKLQLEGLTVRNGRLEPC